MRKKITKTTQRHWAELLALADGQGCVKAEDWTSGSHAHTSNRAIPPFVNRVDRRTITKAPEKCRKAAQAFFEEYPRRTKVIVVDRDAISKWLVDHGRS